MYGYLLCYAFFNRKIRLRPKNVMYLCTLFSGVLQYMYILCEGINIKSNAWNSEILQRRMNVRLLNHTVINTFVSKTLSVEKKKFKSDPLLLRILEGSNIHVNPP